MNPETDPVQAHPGLNMQEFTRGEELCQGPSGAVVLAQHTSGTPVVLKVMPVVLNPNQQQQFLSELNMLYNSDHPSICRFYGCTYSEQGDAGSCLYLGLEYCEVRCDLTQSVTLIPFSHEPSPRLIRLATHRIVGPLQYACLFQFLRWPDRFARSTISTEILHF